jgi:hypothetical protein
MIGRDHMPISSLHPCNKQIRFLCHESRVSLRHLSTMLQVAAPNTHAFTRVNWLSRQSKWSEDVRVRGLRCPYCFAM